MAVPEVARVFLIQDSDAQFDAPEDVDVTKHLLSPEAVRGAGG